jgi:hypothetical protein
MSYTHNVQVTHNRDHASEYVCDLDIHMCVTHELVRGMRIGMRSLERGTWNNCAAPPRVLLASRELSCRVDQGSVMISAKQHRGLNQGR